MRLWPCRIASRWMARTTRALMIVTILASALILAAASAQARRSATTNTTGYNLTISLANGPSFTYDQIDAPIFQGILTVPANTTINEQDFSFNLDGKTTIPLGGLTQTSSTTYSYRYESDWSYLSAGQDTAIAQYGGDAHSLPLTFTVRKAPTTLQCQGGGIGYVTSPGVPVTVSVTSSVSGGTYTISFIGGPQALTFPNLTSDTYGNLTGITAPTQYGRYQMTCSFSGTSDFTPAQAPNQAVTISRGLALTGVQLYTNPTTLRENQPWQAYIVLHGQPGEPAPTGSLDINIDRCYAPLVHIGANGETLAQMPPVTACPYDQGINVAYQGDPYYQDAYFSFPSTNPAIPASITGGTTGSTSGSGARATATASTTPTTTPTIGGTATAGTATPGTAHSVNVVASSSSGGGLPLWLLGAAILVIVLGGGTGAWLLVSRRAKSLASVAVPAADAGAYRPPMPHSLPPDNDLP